MRKSRKRHDGYDAEDNLDPLDDGPDERDLDPIDEGLDERDLEAIDEGPDERDLDPNESEDDAPTDECPQCGREIHADTIGCPYCGAAVGTGEASGKPWWVWLALSLAIVAAAMWISRTWG